MKQLKYFGICADKYGNNYRAEPFTKKSQGIKMCPLCKMKMPYNRIENSETSPTLCLNCGKDNNPKSNTYSKEL